jgi:RimJ/RimL family protein N-acetyltransferase
MTPPIVLRDVTEADLLIFFEHQADPDANQMAALPSRDREAFIAHWMRVLRDETVIKKTILYEGQVAGNILSFERSGRREVGYWLGKDYWGKGIASRALAEFLRHVALRPLYAHVAQRNIASRRVLEKCGFTQVGEDKEFSSVDGQVVEGWILKLP